MTISLRWAIAGIIVTFLAGAITGWLFTHSGQPDSLKPAIRTVESADSLLTQLRVRNADLDHQIRILLFQIQDLDRILAASNARHDARYKAFQARRDSLLSLINQPKADRP
ncbi:MAG: hypothetical protein HUU10_12245 [Bacteroidetes bacterium]|nr:hypothetical protein [Bacteroidota bacterium]